MNQELETKLMTQDTSVKPRIAFLGTGWIGHNRLEAIAQSNLVNISAIADPVAEHANKAKLLTPDAAVMTSLDDVLKSKPDGIVIATPSALHAGQSIAALENGISVFCQKPLARTGFETELVVNAARKADRLLGVDLSYRYLKGMKKIKELIDAREIGDIYSINLVFHNAYGPDKKWFYHPALSGGGCVIDLGIHLVDMALWAMNFPKVENVNSRLYANGKLIKAPVEVVEDYASAVIELENDTTVNLTCSWRINAGCDAIIEAEFFGTKGGLALKNVNGSFYDFRAYLYKWTAKEILEEPPDNWGGRAAVDWTKNLIQSRNFNTDIEHIMEVADVLDRIYMR